MRLHIETSVAFHAEKEKNSALLVYRLNLKIKMQN
jgi:hypothetical protein